MAKKLPGCNKAFAFGILCGLLLLLVFFAGCISGTWDSPNPTVAIPESPDKARAATTSATHQVHNGSRETIVVYSAASLTRASGKIGPAFEAENPEYHVVFSLDGTQVLKQKIEAGAYTDVFISAGNTYTNALETEGWFVNGSVQPLTSNYVIVVLPADNPGKIQALSDLGKTGLKIAIGAKEVPVGTATAKVIDNLANSSFDQEWKNAVYRNVVTYETAEPGIAMKVSLGEVDAGVVYESTYASASEGTLIALKVPEKDNYLQNYTIGTMKNSSHRDAAETFETFMLSPSGQQILSDTGFRPVSTLS
jgi:molybdate transport system substrate-binding protein